MPLQETVAASALHAQTSVIGLETQRILVIEPTDSLDLEIWALQNRKLVEQRLAQYGAVLFRGWGIDSAELLWKVSSALAVDLPAFSEESSPRHRLTENVFTSTDYRAEYPIQLHSEYSYAGEWPMKLIFGCLQPADRGGETPIASTTAILARLSSATRALFRERNIMYVRTYRTGVGVGWQDTFATNDRAVVETRCHERGIRLEWLADGALRTRQVGAAIVHHPSTGVEVWFNHAFFFNVAAIEPLEMRQFFLEEGEDTWSTQTYFGDGTRIPDDVLEELREAYKSEKVACPWQRGDVFLLDNMLTAHGREPFEGSRRIAVVMADKMRRADLR